MRSSYSDVTVSTGILSGTRLILAAPVFSADGVLEP